MSSVQGFVESGYERVAEAFESSPPAEGSGAAVAVCMGGNRVVDLWIGESAPGRRWVQDTLCQLWSVGKGLLSVVALVLSDRGLLDVEAAVEQYWPEFALGGPAKRHALRVFHPGPLRRLALRRGPRTCCEPGRAG